jgi:Tetracyclin repressor-like, C-terminal domain
VRFHAEHAGYFALLDVERADATHAALLREGTDIYLRDVLALIRAGQRDGLVPEDDDASVLAVGVLGAVSSFTHAWRSGRITMDPDALAVFVGAWVVRAVAASRH